MAIEIITEFAELATVRFIAYVRDDDGALTDPTTSIKISIVDADGEPQVTNRDMNGDHVTGIYEYYFNIVAGSAKGWWPCKVVVVDGEYTSIQTFGFKVK